MFSNITAKAVVVVCKLLIISATTSILPFISSYWCRGLCKTLYWCWEQNLLFWGIMQHVTITGNWSHPKCSIIEVSQSVSFSPVIQNTYLQHYHCMTNMFIVTQGVRFIYCLVENTCWEKLHNQIVHIQVFQGSESHQFENSFKVMWCPTVVGRKKRNGRKKEQDKKLGRFIKHPFY